VVDLRVGAPRLATLGTVDDTVEVARATEAGTVVLSASDLGPARTAELVHALGRDGRRVEVVTGVDGVDQHRLRARRSRSGAVLAVAPVSRYTWREPVKRAVDVVLSSLLLVLCAPVLGAAALAVRMADGPGVLFQQVRVGRDGQRFTIYKLRTMVPDAEERLGGLLRHNEASGPMFKMRQDPRVTQVGRFLRDTSVDELPQLWNVIRGDMSLVGPRPALPREAAQWDDPLRERLRVRPGITGPWQVHGRFTASLDDYERLDVGYVDNWTLLGDLRILLRTLPAVLARSGAA
jgi:exopolysaccharide biosynthesis polyprenyl glycosylphosphotransferase